MTVRTLDWPDDQDAILAHFEQVYGPQQVAGLAASYGQTPDFDPGDCFVIDGDSGGIVAHAMIIPRRMQIGPGLLPVAELGAISVLDEYRARDYAALLADVLHLRVAERGDVLSLTFGTPDMAGGWHYEAAAGLYMTSFVSSIPVARALNAGRWDMQQGYERRMAERFGARSQPVVVRRFYSDDLAAVQLLYRAASMRGHYLFARSEDDWFWQLDHLSRTGRFEPDDFLVAEVEGQLAAYVRLVTREPVNLFHTPRRVPVSVIEAVGTHPDAVEALLAAVAQIAQALDAEQIDLFVHPESAFMQHALARGASLRMFTGAAYMRLHSLTLALGQLRPVLEDRLANSRFAARAIQLAVSTEDERAAITVGYDDADYGSPEFVALDVPARAFVRLITGWYGMANLLAASYHERHAELLHVLFPQRDPKIGMADVL